MNSYYDPVNIILKYFKVLNYPAGIDGVFLPVLVARKVVSRLSLFSQTVLETVIKSNGQELAMWIQNPESRTQCIIHNTKYRIHNTEYKIQNRE